MSLRLGQEIQALPRAAELTEPLRRIHVVAAVLRDGGHVLVNRRPAGKPMAGSLEFPGGKLHAGEGRLEGLRRELAEELGVTVESARPLIRYLHRYPDLEVDLDVWMVEAWSGTPAGLEGQALAWLPPDELMAAGLLPADVAVVGALGLPQVCAVTPPEARAGEGAFLDALEDLAAEGRAGLVVLRRPDLAAGALAELAAGAACRVEGTATRLVLHGDPGALGPLVADPPAHLAPRLAGTVAGLHVPARFLAGLEGRPVPRSLWFGVSCHDRAELEAAARAGADYAFLGSVKATASHPGRPGIGWDGFAEAVGDLALPVYAIGGLEAADLGDAWRAGAQGIAAIRSLWAGTA